MSLTGGEGLAALKKKVGARIRDRRNTLDMSQENLAFRSDLTPTYLSQIETGKRNPTIEALFNIAAELQLELSELLES